MPLTPRNFRTPAALACFLLTAVIGLGVDLWTKKVAFEKLAPWGVRAEPDGRLEVYVPRGADGMREAQPIHTFIPGWLNFQAKTNQGAVFGIGQGQRALFLIVSIAAILFLAYLFAASGDQRFYQFILGLLLGGVLGNMYDRLMLGYVRDMLYIFPGRFIMGREVFPWIFNIADSMLCVGVALIFLYSFRRGPKTDAPTTKAGVPATDA